MKIILIQNTTYIPTNGGSDKSNKLLLETLAGRGHDCMVIAPAVKVDSASNASPLTVIVNVRVLSGIPSNVRLSMEYREAIDNATSAVSAGRLTKVVSP